MLIIHGSYHFWPKRVGFRNDYCLWCKAPRRAIAIRTLDVGHIFWIPILPIGFWKHWRCSVCGRQPHVNPRTRPFFKWIGLVCMVLLSLMLWLGPTGSEVTGLIWILRFALSGGAVLFFIHLVRAPREPSLREQLAMIPSAPDTICPFCRTPLVIGAGTRSACPACGVVKY